MSKSIHHTLFFPNSAEEVWEYLTKSELISQWLMENDFQPIVGHDFQFKTKPLPNYNFDGVVYCKVLEIIPNKKLKYSWKGGWGNGKITLDSIVEWTLHDKDNGIELELLHSGFREADIDMFSIMHDGWFKIVRKIYKLVNNEKYDATNA